MKTLKKAFNYLVNSLYFKVKSKRHGHLHYYFKEDCESNVLVVSFAGFPGKGGAKYNYVKTLNGVKCNQLFLLDNFGYKKRGSYYLGGKGFFLKSDIVSLIELLTEKHSIQKRIMIGSSKGGTSALYYALLCNADYCVIGAPQYYLGNYLSSDDHLKILESIMGDTDVASQKCLNRLLPDLIDNYCGNITVYLHYSKFEHTYQDHIEDMIYDMKRQHINVVEDSEYAYTLHSEVAEYFPLYLLNTLKELI